MATNRYRLEALFGKILNPFEVFLKRTTSGGLVLIGASLLSLLIANSPLGPVVHHFWEYPARIGVGEWRLELTLHHWVNEGLMAFFFLMVGLELKREILVGELASLREAALPVAAAIGGMLAPALIYVALNSSGPASAGWGIPMATDIAFAVGILVLLAWRIPPGLIIFLTALAIADDLGAVLVIALFYTGDLHMGALVAAGCILGLLILFNQGGIRHPLPYALLGFLLWFALLKSGIHATIAGVLLAATIPARQSFGVAEFQDRIEQLQGVLKNEGIDSESCEYALKCPMVGTVAMSLEKSARAVQSPQQHLEHTISPWVTFLVLPLFAFSNVAVDFSKIHIGGLLFQPVTLGVILGLTLGKFLGISFFSWLAVTLRIARLPAGIEWRHIMGTAWLGGIGFTMSLFISQLAFYTDPILLEESKIGILVASALSAGIGLAWLYVSGRKADHLEKPPISG